MMKKTARNAVKSHFTFECEQKNANERTNGKKKEEVKRQTLPSAGEKSSERKKTEKGKDL